MQTERVPAQAYVAVRRRLLAGDYRQWAIETRKQHESNGDVDVVSLESWLRWIEQSPDVTETRIIVAPSHVIVVIRARGVLLSSADACLRDAIMRVCAQVGMLFYDDKIGRAYAFPEDTADDSHSAEYERTS